MAGRCTLALCVLWTASLLGGDNPTPTDSFTGHLPRAIGLSAKETSVLALASALADDLATDKTRILVVGGTDGSADSAAATLSCLQWFAKDAEAAPFRERFELSGVPWSFPDQLRGEVLGQPAPVYPPGDSAYGGAEFPAAAYLWRWIGMHAPDLVVEVRVGDVPAVFLPPSDDSQLQRLGSPSRRFSEGKNDHELVAQLVRVPPSGTGTVPALRLQVPGTDDAARVFRALLTRVEKAGFNRPSPARIELQRRLDRSALTIAKQLSKHYGHELKTATYIPAVALIGRLRLGELTKSSRELEDVERIVAPYRSGDVESLPEKASGSYLSGHLIFAELARATKNDRYIEIARRAADSGFDADGNPKESMPYHAEMSDAVFMGCPILANVGALTGEMKYFDQCVRHMRFMLTMNLREDGIHRHSPLDPSAWGRGNGFPALGLALSLSVFPEDHPGRAEMLAGFRSHIAALVGYQDVTGPWHQVVDVPGSYRELSSTCMITFAMARGVRSGWLESIKYKPIIQRAWRAIRMRVADDGRLVDVCTGTGKQTSRRAYFDRRAILGPDPRGGAMSLLVATEMALWESEER